MLDPFTPIQGIEHLEDLLSTPTPAVVDLMSELQGDIIFLGAGGKIGPSIARMARKASDLAGVRRRVIAVSRFSDLQVRASLEEAGVKTVQADLLDQPELDALPDAPNVVFLAGFKFGSADRPALTWGMNTWMPGAVCRRYAASRIVAFSTGGVYGLSPVADGGSLEGANLNPIGEYAMSCLGRERVFQYFSERQRTPVVLVRLFYAAEMRYGVLVDLARSILADAPISLDMGWFNVIWQGDANAQALLAFRLAASPAVPINVTGPVPHRIREVAGLLAAHLGKRAIFTGTEQETACLGNTDTAQELFGKPRVPVEEMVKWTADWMRRGGATHNKPTHFEVRDGLY